jgi:3',5'-cyclic AMP phosphodiesterase CpdA
MNRAVIDDMNQLNLDAVIVKGDLTSLGTLAEYDRFREFYEPAFGSRLTFVRGNHDSYPGLVFADWSVQIVDVEGLRIVLLDTSRDHESSGFIGADQVVTAREAAGATTGPVVVMGHHPLFVPDVDNVRHFDGVRPSDSAALLDGLRSCENVVAYTAGHTHRCRRATVGGVAIVEVACVKDFPGAWAEYQIGTTGIAQIVHRASGAAAIAWAEKTREMFDGYYATYALGELSDRCFTLPLTR